LAGGGDGGESIAIDLGPSYYLFYAKKTSLEADPIPLALSSAQMNVYSAYSDEALVELNVPTANRNSDVWLGFCFNGLLGPAGIISLYETRIGDEGALLDICERWYGVLDLSNTGETEV
jgi:hypothetical protein